MVLRNTECHECGSPTGAHNLGCHIGHLEANREVARLQGTLRYIAAQAKAGHEGVDENAARQMAARCLPELNGRFTLIRWYGHLHPDNCISSGGKRAEAA